MNKNFLLTITMALAIFSFGCTEVAHNEKIEQRKSKTVVINNDQSESNGNKSKVDSPKKEKPTKKPIKTASAKDEKNNPNIQLRKSENNVAINNQHVIHVNVVMALPPREADKKEEPRPTPKPIPQQPVIKKEKDRLPKIKPAQKNIPQQPPDINHPSYNGKYLRLSVRSRNSSSEEKQLADEIVQLVKPGLTSIVAIETGSDGVRRNVQLEIRPKLRFLDRTGDYYLVDCSVDLELRLMNRIFGAETIKLPAAKRIPGKDEAILQFGKPAAQAIVKWSRMQIKRICETEIGISDLEISFPPIQNDAKASVLINVMGKRIRKLNNLIDCQLIRQNGRRGNCLYRVVYFRRAYPDGIVNAVGEQLKTTVKPK